VVDSADDIAFWIVAVIVAAVFFGLVVAAAKWLLDRAYSPK
jgi:riboflavin transporter FmnP